MPYDDIVRDGFACAFGRFYAQGRVERIDGSSLKAMFLPRLTAEANTLLQRHYRDSFVCGQLQHYGVDYDEKDISGNGTLLLKKVLKAGKCDEVPDHIKELRLQMHTEWLEKMSEEELSGHPEWLMEKYFVDGSGEPDSTKTTKVVGIPYPQFSNYRTGQLREAAGRVPGLHHATGHGSTQTIYLGWDRNAVEKAAKNHGAKEAKADQAKADAREKERASKHEKYLADAKKPKFGPKGPSVVGRYMIDCEEIEGNWSDLARDMTLGIRATSTPGIYQASFDFGVIEGIMMLSADDSALNQFGAQQEHDDDFDNEDDDDDQDEEEYERPIMGSKRKAPASKTKAARGRPPTKKAKAASASKPTNYFLRLKSRDTGTGEINYTAENGTIKFSGPDLSRFTGKADMGCIGRGVDFKARKISGVPPNLTESWDDYSQAAYDRARVGRWR